MRTKNIVVPPAFNVKTLLYRRVVLPTCALVQNRWRAEYHVIPDEQEVIEKLLIDLVGC